MQFYICIQENVLIANLCASFFCSLEEEETELMHS